MRENFMDTAESILRFRTSRDPLVRKMVITLIPTLGVYDTQTFSEHFLHKAMGHLLTLLSKSHERSFGAPDLSPRLLYSDRSLFKHLSPLGTLQKRLVVT
jgi:hypothetical protein